MAARACLIASSSDGPLPSVCAPRAALLHGYRRVFQHGTPGFATQGCVGAGSRDLGGEGQVLRALRGLVREGRLVRLGYGVYGRAETSQLSGQPILAAPGGFIDAARQALDKLGVPWEPTEFQRAYNEGRSTQVPINPAVRVKNRFARRLSYQDTELRLER
jgi:hypothetical protein